MITIDWKGKIGYGDIISPMCYSFNMAMKNCTDVTLHMHWLHKKGEKFKEADSETIDQRMKILWSVCEPASKHNVYLQQTFNEKLSYNHTNYDDFQNLHNMWFSRIRNLGNGRPLVVLNTTKGHAQQFSEYDPGKQWKDPLGIEKWQRVENLINYNWGMEVAHVDYTTKTRDAVDLYRKAFLAVGYHGSSMWLARYLRVPMLIYSEKPITRSAFPWAVVKDRFEETEFLNLNPYKLRDMGIKRIAELEKQLDIYFNIPNIHRLRGERT